MRELIQGFIEHCEFSESLEGRIERFVYSQGRKYGFPTFTIYGPPQPGQGSRFLNLIGVNDGEDKTAAETLLQLIERLAMQPHIAAGHVLRILPVSDPLALEQGQSLPSPEVVRGLRGHVDAFRNEPSDGLIELRLTNDDVLHLSAQGPTAILQAVSSGEDALRRLQSEEFPDAVAVRHGRTEGRGPWILTVDIPRRWPASLAVHWTSQFLVVFFRALVTEERRVALESIQTR